MSNAALVTHCGVDGGRDSREVTHGQSTGVDILNGKGFKSNPQNGCNPSIPRCLPAGSVDAKRDLLLPSDQLWTWNRSDAVKLRTDSKQTVPKTVMTSFKETAHKFANHPALAVKVDGVWKKWTYQEYYRDVWRAAKALIRLGLERYNGVGIIGFNSPEWFIADLATIFAGGFATGIYATNSPEACRYIAHNAQCNVIFVEDDHQLQKILQVRTQLPHLKVIVQYKGQPNKPDGNVYSWEEFMQFSEGIPDAVLQKIIDDQAVNQCCSLIYTSGTTGNPKGVMMSHDNLMWTANHSVEMVGLVEGEDTVVSYLPLSHIAAQILDIFIPVTHAATIYFAQPDALKGSLGETLKEVRPTIFFGVPRVWEKMQAKMTYVVSRQSHMKKVIANWAYKIGLKGSLAKMNHRGTKPAGWSIANRLVFAKVRAALGLDKCHHFLTAAAPIAKETLEFFYSLDIIILELFGMSETSGPHTISTHTAFRIGSVGPIHQDSPVVILNKDADGNGEIGLSGRNMFMGYLNEEEKTKETFESNGYVRSGDIGRIDESGFLYITGRIKELLITAGGENIAPVPIEDAVKAALPQCVSNCMLVGDKQKFLSLLITLKTEIDAETSEPLDKLSPHTLAWCQSVGSHATCVSQIISNEGDDQVIAAIQAGIDEANKKAVSKAQHIQKWSIVPRDFTLSGGELGPTLKLRRHVVTEMYKDTINALYTRAG